MEEEILKKLKEVLDLLEDYVREPVEKLSPSQQAIFNIVMNTYSHRAETDLQNNNQKVISDFNRLHFGLPRRWGKSTLVKALARSFNSIDQKCVVIYPRFDMINIHKLKNSYHISRLTHYTRGDCVDLQDTVILFDEVPSEVIKNWLADAQPHIRVDKKTMIVGFET